MAAEPSGCAEQSGDHAARRCEPDVWLARPQETVHSNVRAVVPYHCDGKVLRHTLHVQLQWLDHSDRWLEKASNSTNRIPPKSGKQRKLRVVHRGCIRGTWRVSARSSYQLPNGRNVVGEWKQSIRNYIFCTGN